MTVLADIPVPDTVDINPSSGAMAANHSLQFTATGHYADSRPDIDLTGYAAWDVDDSAVATIKTGLPSGVAVNAGLAHGVAIGDTTVHAELDFPTSTIFPAPAALHVTGGVITEPTHGRFCMAFDSATLDPAPVWEAVDDYPNLVTSYTIDRGRQYELDRTDVGRATVTITDPDGILDPTNPDGPYYGKIESLVQAVLCRRGPTDNSYHIRYRGFVDEFDYIVDPSQRFNRLSITLIDLYEIIASVEMWCGQFGDFKAQLSSPSSTSDAAGQVYYAVSSTPGSRIASVLADCGIPRAFWAIVEGTQMCGGVVYSNGESALTALQDAADSDFPAVATIFVDRQGRFCFRDRMAKFYPESVAAEIGPGTWDYHAWKVGDGTAVNASPTDTVQVREFGFQRGLSKIINTAAAMPSNPEDWMAGAVLVLDADSIGKRGIRSWSADGLLCYRGSASATIAECVKFGEYYVLNYSTPHNRIAAIGFRSLHPSDPRAPALWAFLNQVDIGDAVAVTVHTATGGFESVDYIVEGIHEDVRPLAGGVAGGPESAGYDDVTMHLDLSPKALYNVSPWPDPPVVSSRGMVTGVAPGVATITGRFGSADTGFTEAVCTVTVVASGTTTSPAAPPASFFYWGDPDFIEVLPSTATIVVGETLQLISVAHFVTHPHPNSDYTLNTIFESNNLAVATVVGFFYGVAS